MLTVAIPKRNKLQNIIVLTPKDGTGAASIRDAAAARSVSFSISLKNMEKMLTEHKVYSTCLSELS